MRFDDGGLVLAALDDVGIDGALHQKVHSPDLLRLDLEHLDEFRADDLALFLRFADAFELFQEALARVRADQIHAEAVFEHRHDLFRLALSEEPVIDEHAGELTAYGAVHECCRNGGIHAPGHGAQHLFIADLFFQQRDLFGDEAAHRPVPFRPAHAVEEIFQQLVPVFRMHDFRVELHAVDRFFRVSVNGDGAGRRGREHRKPVGNFRHMIGMAHPADARLRDPLGERALFQKGKFPLAVFAHSGVLHLSAERICDQLASVTDPEHGDPEPPVKIIPMGS